MSVQAPLIASGLVVAALSAAGVFDYSLLLTTAVELPALLLLGWSLRSIAPAPRWLERCNAGGLTGLLLAMLLLVLWMIPSAMDLVKIDAAMRAARIASLVLGVGYALRVSWPMTGLVMRWVWHLEAAGMMLRFGVAYLFADRTLCSGISSSDQRATGAVLCLSGIAYLIGFGWKLIHQRGYAADPGSHNAS